MAANENLNVLREGRGADGGPQRSAEGLTRRVESEVRVGRSGLDTGRSRLFRYDRIQGLAGAQLKCETDQADRMPDVEAVAMLQSIHEAYLVSNEVESYLYDFDHAMFLCYAMNGASQVGPYERVGFRVVRHDDSGTVRFSNFDYLTVAALTGVSMRRFFRAYADEVVVACRKLYFQPDHNDPMQMELRARMVLLANDRGVSRHPYLIADCADAATNVSLVEHSTIVASKSSVIASSTNAVDQLNSSVPIRSMDNFDSTLGHNVSAEHDIHAKRPGFI